MNKAKRIIDNMDKEAAATICSQIGTIDENATPLKQARYINDILNVTGKMNICMTYTMRKCGGCCLSANAVKIAKKLYAKSNNITEFLDLLNEADIGGKHLLMLKSLIPLLTVHLNVDLRFPVFDHKILIMKMSGY